MILLDKEEIVEETEREFASSSLLNSNPLVQHLEKPSEEFTKEDIVKFVKGKDIQILNLCHVAEDGRLKTLSFVINNEKYLTQVLEGGERVDGSSLFSYIDVSESDIFVLPIYRTAFINPFNAIPTLNILCEYFDRNGKPLEFSPRNILRKAGKKLLNKTGVTLEALPELEFYVIFKREKEPLYPGVPQKNYHESTPFAKCEPLRNEVMTTLAKCGVPVKYSHSEVGLIPTDEFVMEQHEIEFLLQPFEVVADTLTIAKWVIRNIGAKYGVTISFAPKLMVGHAGNGMHIHMRGLKNRKSIMTNTNRELTKEAKRMIGGILKFAPSLTAFGNTVPVSYLRLVPHQEAPTYLCWGYRNRSALVRIPALKQTLEFRSPDASANIYLLLAGVTVAVEHGLTNNQVLKLADDLYVDTNVYDDKKVQAKLKELPGSCYESAEYLEKDKPLYEKENVFPREVLDGTVRKLKNYEDEKLGETLKDVDKANEFMKRYIHCG
ncbi:MAG: Glutamine synthetase [Candidatus Bathyarchaeota archaeon BA2]|nr:MAG: Glutamine synthetase [Candidatus Bathyarchaeota archaeon BA2]